jgi:hypothetical protein
MEGTKYCVAHSIRFAWGSSTAGAGKANVGWEADPEKALSGGMLILLGARKILWLRPVE